MHWDKDTAGKRCLGCIFIRDKDADGMFIRDKNAALGKHGYPRDGTPLDAFLSGIKLQLAFLFWGQVECFYSVLYTARKIRNFNFQSYFISFLISSVGIFLQGGEAFLSQIKMQPPPHVLLAAFLSFYNVELLHPATFKDGENGKLRYS